MNNKFTLQDNLLTCLEDAWPFLCPEDDFETYFQQAISSMESNASDPAEATVSAILAYSRALSIVKITSSGIPVEVVLN
jgi:hypothetical protein